LNEGKDFKGGSAKRLIKREGSKDETDWG